MASYSDITSIVSSGGTISCNGGAVDSLWIDPMRSVGLDGRRVRAPIDNRGQDHGYILHPEFFREGMHIVLVGLIDIRSESSDPGYVTARDAFISLMQAVLNGMHSATETLNFGSRASLTVKNDTGYDFPSASERGPTAKSAQFGLVTAT
ncbi:MAG: hypothetical protein ACR2L3_05870 [Actinomycetota bacterium]